MEHDWKKENLVTIYDEKDDTMYDRYKCSKCDEYFRQYTLEWNPPNTECKA